MTSTYIVIMTLHWGSQNMNPVKAGVEEKYLC